MLNRSLHELSLGGASGGGGGVGGGDDGGDDGGWGNSCRVIRPPTGMPTHGNGTEVSAAAP